MGKGEMNSMLEEVSTCLYAGRVPGCWSRLSPQTVKSLARYVEHLTKRTLQYSNWVKYKRSTRGLMRKSQQINITRVNILSEYLLYVFNQSQIREPLVMWLSGLHAPKSYLISLIQLACRKYGWSIEHSMFHTSVTRWTCESEVQREPDAVSIKFKVM